MYTWRNFEYRMDVDTNSYKYTYDITVSILPMGNLTSNDAFYEVYLAASTFNACVR